MSRRQLVTLFLYTLVILFFGAYIANIDYSSLSSLHFNLTYLGLATLASLIFRYWGVIIWVTVLKDLGSKKLPPFLLLSCIYSKAWLARYIPGSVGWIAGKIYLASGLGISKSRLAVSSLLEGGMQIVALFSISLLLISFDGRLDIVSESVKFTLVLISFTCILILNPRIFNPLIKRLYKFIKKKDAGEELLINSKATYKSFALYAFGGLISGSAFYLLVKAVSPDTPLNILFYLIGSFNLSGAVGMATPLLPSGIGVRDGVLLLLLTAVFPPEIALAITVLSRLWSAVVDIIFYALSNSLNRFFV